MNPVIEQPDKPIIQVNAVSKAFPLVKQRDISLRHEASSLLWSWIRGQHLEAEAFYALQEVSLSICRGEAVAIIGRNGSGKTTLLRLIAGVLRPTTGTIEVRANFAPLLGLGTGFNTVLTGRQNIILNAALLGLSAAQTHALMDEMIAFADIGAFIDVPTKTYSSGMNARLAISVVLHCVPDILLIDEILAVGDAAFQKKCWSRMDELKASGRTLLIVSHMSNGLDRLCERGIWLEQGRVQADGQIHHVLNAYQHRLYG